MKLADSHCHLDDSQFAPDREAVVARALEAGVGSMLAIGTGDGPPDLEAAVRVADQYAFVYATAGVHPNDVAKIGADTFHNLRGVLQHPKLRAVGEIGLDYHWGVPRELQIPAFISQLELAAESRMPVVIHTRDAWQDTMSVLRTHWATTKLPCVMHCFTGDRAQAEECLTLGFYLAYGGVATFPKSAAIREAARITPLDCMLLETDSPYLAPVPYRGKRNEPAYVAHTARALAETLEIAPEDLAEATTRNFERLFITTEKGIRGGSLH